MQLSNAAEILQVIKEQLAEQLSRPKYELLIRPLTAVDFTPAHGDGTAALTLGISNEVLRGWLLDQYGDLLGELAQLICGQPVMLSIEVVVGALVGGAPAGTAASAGLSVLGEPVPAAPEETVAAEPRRPLLNPRYSFDNFIVGKANQFAYSACYQVAQRPGLSYNPLFLYGGVGLGKTHLLHAIGHTAWERDHRLGVLYVTSEKFTNEFIECVRTGQMPRFHGRYREASVLLIDDIQFLAGKPETQQEFFHTFMALIEGGRQLVISSDRPPRTLRGIEDRLLSRFSMGLVCDLGEPGLETRVAILRQKARLEQVELSEEVCQFIAERVSGNVRELEGALIRLLAFCDFSKSTPDLEVAARVLADFVEPGGIRPQLSIKQIMGVVGEYFNVSEQLLLSPNRSKRVALARMVVMYLAREYTNLTLSQIGAELGGRDHSTISHGVNKIARELLEDPYIEQSVTQISRMLK
jgi:chromosomal replication initiator protein